MDENLQNETELDLSQLMRILIVRWYIIVASVIVVFGLVTVYAFVVADDEYTAERTFAISVQAEDTNTATNYSLAERLVNTYIDFSKSKIVFDDLKDILNAHPDLDRTYTNQYLNNVITISERGAQSIAIEISVTTGDPEEAAIIANELFNVIDQLTRSNEIENLETIDGWGIAEAPAFPSGPNRLLYMVIGVILGGMLGVFAVFMIEFLDKSVKSTTEIENKIGLRVLGIIPDYDMEVEVNE
ncbi:MAG: YveK family protein [Bacillota bacterium]